MLGWISSPKAHNQLQKVCDDAVQCRGRSARLNRSAYFMRTGRTLDCAISEAGGVASLIMENDIGMANDSTAKETTASSSLCSATWNHKIHTYLYREEADSTHVGSMY